jgi:hypothetical protein
VVEVHVVLASLRELTCGQQQAQTSPYISSSYPQAE